MTNKGGILNLKLKNKTNSGLSSSQAQDLKPEKAHGSKNLRPFELNLEKKKQHQARKKEIRINKRSEGDLFEIEQKKQVL